MIDLRLGDCLEVMKGIPDGSVDLIATDPPYHRVKSEAWDRQWKTDADYLDWIGRLCGEWARVLKPNGSLYCFASPRMAARVECKIGETFEVLSSITWTKPNDPGFDGWHRKANKESLRAWYPTSERIIFAAPETFPSILATARIKAGFSAKELAAKIGAHGQVNHGGSVSNWELGLNFPTDDQYQKLREILDIPPADRMRRHFAVSAAVPYGDVWNFRSVRARPGKHPCEKPLAMMEHIVGASSRPGAVVLDCFSGSGVTGEACQKLGRSFILIDTDPKWIERSRRRLAPSPSLLFA